jgi:hypothetical protein
MGLFGINGRGIFVHAPLFRPIRRTGARGKLFSKLLPNEHDMAVVCY